ncbi:MAG: helix-turn-helix domain-containing protein [Pseudomonadota bacterium]
MTEPDAFLRICPSRDVMGRIGEKWSTLVIVALSEGRLRFGELRKRLDGISQKMLSQTLRNLERDGLVSREVFDERPLRVEYSLTPIGDSLVPLVTALKAWAQDRLQVIEAARKAFDARQT